MNAWQKAMNGLGSLAGPPRTHREPALPRTEVSIEAVDELVYTEGGSVVGLDAAGRPVASARVGRGDWEC